MNLKRIKKGQSQELQLKNGDSLLISYSTVVAACVAGKRYRTDKHWSPTTSKHINQWLKQWSDTAMAESRPQEWFDSLIEL
jgi:UTP-glucose-1-phosphate uridylyltransferase